MWLATGSIIPQWERGRRKGEGGRVQKKPGLLIRNRSPGTPEPEIGTFREQQCVQSQQLTRRKTIGLTIDTVNLIICWLQTVLRQDIECELECLKKTFILQ